MNYDEINALTIETTYYELLLRILDFSGVPDGEAYVSLNPDEGLEFYDRIEVHVSLIKPTLAALESELVEYKAELTAAEDARLVEVARVQAIKDRWNAISDINGAAVEAGLFQPNMALELKRIIDEDDMTTLKVLEAAAPVHDAKVAQAQAKSARKELGRQARRVCEDVLDIIAGFNLERTLTAEQITTMQSTFAAIDANLRASRPWSAKPLIEAISPDEVLVTTEMKTELLEVFTEAGI